MRLYAKSKLKNITKCLLGGVALLSNMALASSTVQLSAGDTAWMLMATILVIMMTLPGLALFYGGMVRKKNVLSTMMYTLSTAAVVTVVWVVIGYSIAFAPNTGSLSGFVGGFDRILMGNIPIDQLWSPMAGVVTTIPENLFMMFQLAFAIITTALISGAFAERMKFSAFLLFSALWSLLVYAPIAHWVWSSDGWLYQMGALDYAGGTVVHVNAGVAGLVCAVLLGKRLGWGKEVMAPHNLGFTIMGASLLWVGWFGFNAGSALAANSHAVMAMVVTQIAAATACLVWMLIEIFTRGRASTLGAASGVVAGLVAITPASGYVNYGGAFIIGIVAGVCCFYAVTSLKRIFKIDDSLDAFGIHGMGGIVGAILTGVLVTPLVSGLELKPMIYQVYIQLEAVGATAIYSALVTAVILFIIDFTVGLRAHPDDEQEGLDITQHGEHIQ